MKYELHTTCGRIVQIDVATSPIGDVGMISESNPRLWFFLDDEREPPIIPMVRWAIFRTGEDMLAQISRYGLPDGISFDHDLGEDTMSGHDVAKRLIWLAIDEGLTVPDEFAYKVHSANPVGEKNIHGAMNDLRRWSSGEFN